ncbi:Gfo/Idh/MocA family protein [Haloarchaeobius sp. HME9146]|uniref:Gfo/Idh/MocA family protein n=1 Tax=Haloarchaeobius sp. HME9146 TaxID=2978732 RepID=UPI0021BF8968|nr:Gfo/Idh/MocA family oxidoreductase [Haloarchaeobius sp. HME9146]MCT9098016.1 Gfo/Idh/MocA family oxidoreductase [Haloarchaeobius sp. HME9146]
MLGLDTSHPASFGPILEAMPNASVTSLWDGGDVREESYCHELAAEYDATLYDDPEDMLGSVDGVLVMAVNWDTHVSLAEPFLEAGVPTLIDKPVVGCLADLETLESLATGTPLFGGSSVSFHPRLSDFPTGVPDRLLYGAGYNDPFYYGSHMTDTARRIAGADWVAADCADYPGAAVDIEFENGATAVLRLDGPSQPGAFGLLDVSDETRSAVIGGTEEELQKMYRSYLQRFLDIVEGERDESRRILDSASLLLGVRAALETGGRVTPDSSALRETTADGHDFLDSYQPYATS